MIRSSSRAYVLPVGLPSGHPNEHDPLCSQPSEGFFIVDAAQRVVGWSSNMEEIMGVSCAEALGQHCYELMWRFQTRDPLPCSEGCRFSNGGTDGEIPVNVLRRDHGLGAWSLRHEAVGSPEGMLLLHRLRDATLDVISIRFLRRVLEAMEDDVGELRQVGTTAYADNVSLTRREIDVLRLLAEGISTRMIAKRLSISYYTVRNYVQKLMTKLGAHNRVETIMAAQRLGLLKNHNRATPPGTR